MPIEVKELIVRAWVNAQPQDGRGAKEVGKSGNETSPMNSEMLEQLKRALTDIKDR